MTTTANITYTHVQMLLIHMFKRYLYTCSNVTYVHVQKFLIHMLSFANDDDLNNKHINIRLIFSLSNKNIISYF